MMISHAEIVLRLCVAAFSGSVIGLERERMLWAAGLRTHMLVSIGSCLIMIISAYGFFDVLETGRIVLDPSRIAAQVVSGIGFLGAGAILLRKNIVRGLTTAASIWIVAGIGLAAGSGLYFAAIVTTFIILIILYAIKPLEEKYKTKKITCALKFQATRGEMSLDLIKSVIGEDTNYIQQLSIQSGDSPEHDDVSVLLSGIQKTEALKLIEQLKTLSCIKNSEIMTTFTFLR